MTPGQYIALARDIGLVVGIALILLFVYRSGEDRLKASDLKSLQAQIQQQAKTVAQWRKESTDANDQLSKDLSAIAAAAAIPVQHVWVRDTSCPKSPVLSPATGKASPQPAPGGGVRPVGGDVLDGPRRDRIVAAFKQRWETEFARCRALDTQWPQP